MGRNTFCRIHCHLAYEKLDGSASSEMPPRVILPRPKHGAIIPHPPRFPPPAHLVQPRPDAPSGTDIEDVKQRFYKMRARRLKRGCLGGNEQTSSDKEAADPGVSMPEEEGGGEPIPDFDVKPEAPVLDKFVEQTTSDVEQPTEEANLAQATSVDDVVENPLSEMLVEEPSDLAVVNHEEETNETQPLAAVVPSEEPLAEFAEEKETTPLAVKPAEETKPLAVKPAEETKPLVAVKPAEETQPLAAVKTAEETQPLAAVKTAEETKPLVAVKPAEETQPLAAVKTAEETQPLAAVKTAEEKKPAAVKPAEETKPLAAVKPAEETKPLAPVKPAKETKPLAAVKPAKETKPSAVKPLEEKSLAKETKPAAVVKPLAEKSLAEMKPAEKKRLTEEAKSLPPERKKAKLMEVEPDVKPMEPVNKPVVGDMKRGKPAGRTKQVPGNKEFAKKEPAKKNAAQKHGAKKDHINKSRAKGAIIQKDAKLKPDKKPRTVDEESTPLESPTSPADGDEGSYVPTSDASPSPTAKEPTAKEPTAKEPTAKEPTTQPQPPYPDPLPSTAPLSYQGCYPGLRTLDLLQTIYNQQLMQLHAIAGLMDQLRASGSLR